MQHLSLFRVLDRFRCTNIARIDAVFVRTTAVVLLLTATLGNALAADNTSSIDVSPKVAPTGIERTITVRGEWPNACPPVAGDVIAEPADKPALLFVRLSVLYTLVPCAQVVTRYQYDFKYTPSAATLPGELPIVLVTNDGRLLANGSMQISGDPAGSRGLSGTWFDRDDPTSILMLSHSNSDFLVGSWALFSASGAPVWNFIHSSRRITPTLIEAQLWEFSASDNRAPRCQNSACPASGWSARQVGTVRLFANALSNRIRVEVIATNMHPTLEAGQMIFETTMSRYSF
jgi:hypothetical protein